MDDSLEPVPTTEGPITPDSLYSVALDHLDPPSPDGDFSTSLDTLSTEDEAPDRFIDQAKEDLLAPYDLRPLTYRPF